MSDEKIPTCCETAKRSKVVTTDNLGRWTVTAYADDDWAKTVGEMRVDDRDGNSCPYDVEIRFCPFCGKELSLIGNEKQVPNTAWMDEVSRQLTQIEMLPVFSFASGCSEDKANAEIGARICTLAGIAYAAMLDSDARELRAYGGNIATGDVRAGDSKTIIRHKASKNRANELIRWLWSTAADLIDGKVPGEKPKEKLEVVCKEQIGRLATLAALMPSGPNVVLGVLDLKPDGGGCVVAQFDAKPFWIDVLALAEAAGVNELTVEVLRAMINGSEAKPMKRQAIVLTDGHSPVRVMVLPNTLSIESMLVDTRDVAEFYAQNAVSCDAIDCKTIGDVIGAIEDVNGGPPEVSRSESESEVRGGSAHCGATIDRFGGLVCRLAHDHAGDHNTASDGTGDVFPNTVR